MNTYYYGIFAEWYARCFLRLRGLKILKSRYITGKNTNRAEIDIIAKQKDCIVFIEVKARPDLNTAWGAITNAQATRLRRAAETFLIQNKIKTNARFDVIAVCKGRIYWEKN
ncbi:MAG: YraN family protein, partial [Alphaproteobacteria bacterium]